MQSDYSVVYSGVSDSDSVPLPSIRVFLDPTFLLLLVPTCVMRLIDWVGDWLTFYL